MNSYYNTIILLVTIISTSEVVSFRCDRRPYGSTSAASPPDGRFKLTVEGSGNSYIPDQLYVVKLSETDGESRFTTFIISAEGDIRPDSRNPRRMVSLYPGELRPMSSSTAKYNDRCLYSLEQTTNNFKPSVEVYWQAPPPGSGCVTLRAMVAENEETWFEDGPPLTLKICEDMRQPDDASLSLNENCRICGEAKYEVSFTGVWSRNTHPQQYPENDWIPKFSDLVGASHTADFILWTPGTLATDGLRDLAEHANTTKFESEIREKIGDGVRTVIKGKGHGYQKMRNPTYAYFRVDKDHHLVTTAVGLYPSPDWFLGVNRFELCQEDNTWLQERELNLYPWDAGTDSGASYESSNLETFPQDAISRVQLSSYDKNSPFYEIDMKDLHPFGKLSLKLVRVYQKDCKEEDAGNEENADGGDEKPSDPAEPEEPSSESPIEVDPEAPEDCPISQWQDWSPCEGECKNGKIHGYKWRDRYHLVDGIAVEKYDPDNKQSPKKEVPEECKEKVPDFETVECTEECSHGNTDLKTMRRLGPVLPGHPWNSKRDTPDVKP